MRTAQRHVVTFSVVGELCIVSLIAAIAIYNSSAEDRINWDNSAHTSFGVGSHWIYAPYSALSGFLIAFSLFTGQWDFIAEQGRRRRLPKAELAYVAETMKEAKKREETRQASDRVQLLSDESADDEWNGPLFNDMGLSLLLGHPVLTWSFSLTAIAFAGVVISTFGSHMSPWFQAFVFWLSGKLTGLTLLCLNGMMTAQLGQYDTSIQSLQYTVGRSLMQNVLNPLLMFVIRIAVRTQDNESNGDGPHSSFIVTEDDIQGIRNSYILSLLIAEVFLWLPWLATRSWLPSALNSSFKLERHDTEVLPSLEQLSFALIFPLVMVTLTPMILVDGAVAVFIVGFAAFFRLRTNEQLFSQLKSADEMEEEEANVRVLVPFLCRVVYYGLYVCGLIVVGFLLSDALSGSGHSMNTTGVNIAVWTGNILFTIVTALFHRNRYDTDADEEAAPWRNGIQRRSAAVEGVFDLDDKAQKRLLGYVLTCPDPLVPVFCYGYPNDRSAFGRVCMGVVARVFFLVADISLQIGGIAMVLLMSRMCVSHCDTESNQIVTFVFGFMLGPVVPFFAMFVCLLCAALCMSCRESSPRGEPTQ